MLFVLFSFLYFLLTSALLRGYLSTRRTDAQTEIKMIKAFYPNKHEDLKNVQMPLMDYGIRYHHTKQNKNKKKTYNMADFWGTLLSHFGLLV